MENSEISKPRKPIEFITWFILSIIVPAIPFFLVWMIFHYFSAADILLDILFGQPDIVFVSIVADASTVFDLLLTVESFKKNILFFLTIGILIISLFLSFTIYSVAVFSEIQGRVNRVDPADLLISTTVFIVSFSLIVQFFLLFYQDSTT